MDGSAILYAGLGAGLGSLIGSLISHKLSNKSLKSVITVLPMIIGLQSTLALYKNMKLPRIFPMDDASMHSENPGLKVLKDNNPEEYKALISILDEPTRKGKVEQTDLDAFRLKLTGLIEEKRGIAPAGILRRQNELTAEQFKVLRRKAPEICTAQANGRPFPVLTELLGEDYRRKEQAVIGEMFSVQPNNVVRDIEAGERVYSEIIAKSVKALSIQTVDPKGDNIEIVKAQHQLICQLFEESSLAVNKLDDESVANVAAYISSESLKK